MSGARSPSSQRTPTIRSASIERLRSRHGPAAPPNERAPALTAVRLLSIRRPGPVSASRCAPSGWARGFRSHATQDVSGPHPTIVTGDRRARAPVPA
jgi:hypothetical protein